VKKLSEAQVRALEIPSRTGTINNRQVHGSTLRSLEEHLFIKLHDWYDLNTNRKTIIYKITEAGQKVLDEYLYEPCPVCDGRMRSERIDDVCKYNCEECDFEMTLDLGNPKECQDKLRGSALNAVGLEP
jgi:DNA-binding PadR family transcriptional regulator